jgi:DNA-binding MarR family transcriptional regulator
VPPVKGSASIRSVRDFTSYRLSVLSRVLDRTTEARMIKTNPLALTENRILGLLFDCEVTTVRAVAKEMCLDKAQVSRAMSKLVKFGYASRTIDPGDRRSAEFKITPKGREYYAGHFAIAKQAAVQMLADLNAEEIAVLDSAIAKLMAFAEERAARTEDELETEAKAVALRMARATVS